MAELDQPGLLAQAQHLAEKRRQRAQMTFAELRDGAEIRRVEPHDAHEVDAFPTSLGDPPRRVDSIAIAVEQQRRHHRRIERRLPALDAVDTLDLFQIDLLDHQVQDEPRQVILVDELLNRRRQQHRFIDLPGAIALAHEQAESDSPPRRQQNPRFLRQAPRLVCGWTPISATGATRQRETPAASCRRRPARGATAAYERGEIGLRSLAGRHNWMLLSPGHCVRRQGVPDRHAATVWP